MTLNDENAIKILEQIIKLNRFDNNIKELFGKSDTDSVLDFVISDLFEVFLFLSNLQDFSDDVFDIVFDERITVGDSERTYKKLMKFKKE